MQKWAERSTELLSALALPTLLSAMGDFRNSGVEFELRESSQLTQSSELAFVIGDIVTKFKLASSPSVPTFSLIQHTEKLRLGEAYIRLRNGSLVLQLLIPVCWSSAVNTSNETWSRLLDIWATFSRD